MAGDLRRAGPHTPGDQRAHREGRRGQESWAGDPRWPSRHAPPASAPPPHTFLAPSFSAFFLASSKSSFWPMLAWEQRQRGEPGRAEGGGQALLSWTGTIHTQWPWGGVPLTAQVTQEEGQAAGCLELGRGYAKQSLPRSQAG